MQELKVMSGTNSLKIEVSDSNLEMRKDYYHIPRVVFSIVWKNKRRREEIYRLYVDQIQASKQKLKTSALWNFYIEDVLLYKNLCKQFALERFDKPDSPLKLNICFNLVDENREKVIYLKKN